MTPTDRLLAGLFLTVTAGIVDAISFLELGGYYTAFVSGNTTQAAVALTALNSGLPVVLVFLFFVGSFLGSVLQLSGAPLNTFLVLVFVVMVIGTGLILRLSGLPTAAAISLLAVAMGAQNASLPMVGAARLGATFVSGSLFGAGQDLARALRGQAPPWRWAQHLMVWGALLAGAAAGALAYRLSGVLSLLLPISLYLVMAVRELYRQRATYRN